MATLCWMRLEREMTMACGEMTGTCGDDEGLWRDDMNMWREYFEIIMARRKMIETPMLGGCLGCS